MQAMVNAQDFISNTTVFRKFEVDDLLFVEIVCPVEEGSPTKLWWHDNFFFICHCWGDVSENTRRRVYC